MSYQALYRTWRPEGFSDIVGQDPIVKTLVNQIATGHVAHAYLFCGSRGTGKTSTAKVFARAINCMDPRPGAQPCGKCEACVQLMKENNMDVFEIDAASNNGVDEIRQLRATIVYPPTVGKYKVYIIDEVHMLSTGAFNALLKTLEEPPAHAVFILATTEPQKLPATILSRCQRYDFKRIAAKVIVKRLKTVLKGIGEDADAEALEDIARAAEGGMRDALSLMDMCLAYASGHLTSDIVRSVLGSTDRRALFDFARALICGDAGAALKAIDDLVCDGRDPSVFAREVTQHLRALLLSQVMGAELGELLEIAEEDAERYRAQGKDLSREGLMRRMELFMNCEAQMKWAAQPRTVLELAAVRACHPEREAGNDALCERVEKLERALEDGAVAVKKEKAQPKPDKAQPKPEEKKRATNAPPAAGNELWQKAIAHIQTAYKSIYPLVEQARFLSVTQDVMTIEIPKKWKMYYTVLSTAKKAATENAISEALEQPMRLQVTLEGAGKAAPSAQRQNLTQAYDVFGRENVVVVDDEQEAPF
ncbi:MAG: DNA polymerase III subunit gamma/tau [Clostridia bacterium]